MCWTRPKINMNWNGLTILKRLKMIQHFNRCGNSWEEMQQSIRLFREKEWLFKQGINKTIEKLCMHDSLLYYK
jgi:hypothetical protein